MDSNIENIELDLASESLLQKSTPDSKNDSEDNNPEENSEELLQEFESLEENDEAVNKFIEKNEEKIKKWKKPNGGNTLLHEAAKNGKVICLKKLINLWDEFKLEEKNDNGDTPMITLLENCAYTCKLQTPTTSKCDKHCDCFEILQERKKDVDHKNNAGLNAISLASMCADKGRGYLNKLLDDNDCEKKVNELHEAIKTKNDSKFVGVVNELNENLKKQIPSLMIIDKKAKYTLLQVVCKNGMIESYKELIKNQAVPYFTPLEKDTPIQLSCLFARPQMLEYLLKDPNNCLDEQKPIVTKNGRNLLHLTVKNPGDFMNSYKCLQILLHQEEKFGSVNDKDSRGRTPLHYALMNDNEECAIQLLKNGAHLDAKDNCKQTPIMLISKCAFKKYLDAMIKETKNREEKGNQHQGKDRKIVGSGKDAETKSSSFKELFRSSCMGKNNTASAKWHTESIMSESEAPERISETPGNKHISQTRSLAFDFTQIFRNCEIKKRKNKPTLEKDHQSLEEYYRFSTDLLSKINKVEDLKELLEHPVLSVIIYFKWRQIRHYFWSHLLIYFFFCVHYTWYIISSNDSPTEPISAKSRLLTTLGYDRKSKPVFVSISLLQMAMDMRLQFIIPLSVIILFFLVLEFLKIIQRKYIAYKDDDSCDTWKCIYCAYNYIRDVDNFIRLIVIILSIIVMICQNSCITSYCPQIKAISILMTWIEFFLVLGKYPDLSFYVTIFRSAFLHLLKFIAIHFALLIGFAFCFHTLFRSTSPDNVFIQPCLAIFKTVVMLTSEFDASDIPFDDHAILSRLIFISYIFIATFVLFNLMIGIAFKKVNEMEQNPFLYECIAQISIIKHYEDIFSQNIISQKVKGLFCKKNQSQDNVKSNGTLKEVKIGDKFEIVWDGNTKTFKHLLQFKSDPRDKVLKIENTNYFDKHSFSSISDEVIKHARKIVSKKYAKTEVSKENLCSKLEAFGSKINEIEKLITINNANKKRITVK